MKPHPWRRGERETLVGEGARTVPNRALVQGRSDGEGEDVQFASSPVVELMGVEPFFFSDAVLCAFRDMPE